MDSSPQDKYNPSFLSSIARKRCILSNFLGLYVLIPSKKNRIFVPHKYVIQQVTFLEPW